MTELDQAYIVLSDATAIKKWKEYSITSDFLTPTDEWSFSFGSEIEWHAIQDLIEPKGSKIGIYINQTLQCTGYVDRCIAVDDPASGIVVSVKGRDMMAPLCDGHVHPDTRFKDRKLADLLDEVMGQIYLRNPPTVTYTNDANRNLIVSHGTGGGAPAASAYDVPTTTPGGAQLSAIATQASQKQIDHCQPHPNEGAFEFIARNIRRHGLWMWCTADGNFVVSGPTYNQPAAYKIVRGKGAGKVATGRASWSVDRTNIPDFMQVRGKAHEKGWTKGIHALVPNPDMPKDRDFITPAYLSHDQAETPAQCKNFALQEMARLKEHEKVYECTRIGHRDIASGNLYQIDTIAQVEDSRLNVHQPLYCATRTFKKSVSGGTSTDLRLIPPGAIRFSDADAP